MKILRFLVLPLALLMSPLCKADCADNSDIEAPASKIPLISAEGLTAKDFVPEGWKKVDTVTSDFDGDGMNDLALTIVENNPKNIIRNDCGLGANEFDSNPYAVIVTLKQKSGKYKLVATDFSLIPRRLDAVLDQPYSGIKAVKNALHVSYNYWQSAGSWTTSHYTYLFRYQQGCMRLIGSEYGSMHRASMEEENISINLITNQGINSKSNPETKKSGQSKFRLKNKNLLCLGKLPDNIEEYATNSFASEAQH